MSVTIRDIAKATGLSLGTISRALKNQSGLTESTRVRVFEVARQLGYDFSKLKSGRVRRIAFLLHRQHNTLSSSPFFSPVLHGAEAACRREGIALSFVAIGPAEPVMEQIRIHQPDAILCAGFFEPEILHAIRAAGKPLVLIDMYLDDFTSINPDNRLGGYLATRHLIQSGRKRIAMLSGPSAHYSIQERVHGFRKALYDAKMLANPELEIAIPHHANEEASVKKAMLKLLAMTQPPDAVFCYNDTTALTAMHACLEAGLKIPHDIAIVGFDNISAAAKSNPPLTSIHVDKEALGAEGVAMLLRKAQDEAVDKTLAVQLMVRESSTDDL
ncbi:LacI family DNA-binding transcriptional regulator [Undibacterium cyanobacteriorum]|uniref:LacI family DNA-binding transcriptional regulator n=1 Tax=Undibacterium cyanobacteriorum TaxID=3073561 RepID=A0ABY9RG20_9BURK|nr:LacI family DNA-binding transcriptional regulator [Undibacterium sp. 20NA77.5]WMW80178.1 LacI family DNA-binding transcriptional regulator [Undibacterium sp. 20NA77.5]